VLTSIPLRTGVWLAGLLSFGMLVGPVQAQSPPRPPLTERYSVQMFQGATKDCWIAVWPPAANADGTGIPYGTKVQIKVYRSLDGGKTYTDRDVKIVGGPGTNGEGFVGQGERNPLEKEWIDCKLETPVNDQEPYAVWLAVTAVVNGKESAKNNAFLTFRYREKGRPALVRFPTPDVSGAGVADDLARPLPQELPGKWADGQFIIRSVFMTPGMKAKVNKGEVEGCNAAVLDALEKKKGVAMGMEVNFKTIDLVQAPGLGGVPVSPEQLTKIGFPGTLTMKIIDPQSPQAAKESEPVGFNYNYRDRFVRFDKADKGTRTMFGGHFFQNATHYVLFGTWRFIFADSKTPGEYGEIRGTWSVSKRKPS